MRKEDKNTIIEQLTATISEYGHFYLVDMTAMNAASTSALRRACYKADIKLAVVKNTLLVKAMEASENNYGELPETLKGNSAIFFSDVANAPAKIMKEFRKKSAKPVLKGAYINAEIYIGDNLLDSLASLKSKEEVIGEIIGLLQSPAQRVISALLNQFKDEEVSE